VPQSEGRQALRRVLAEPSRETMRAFLESLVHDASLVTDELVESRLRLASRPGVLEANRASLASAAREAQDPDLAQRADLRHRLPRVSIPLCLIWGREDRFAPLELGHRLKERLPNLGEFHVLEKAGHQCQNDDPARFQAIAAAFFGAG
jgi:4,5:9,10-diseco-3-hydroxy-5,9,17-trioxoandrosta-1(10),2-diene-4-oate hydrolase